MNLRKNHWYSTYQIIGWLVALSCTKMAYLPAMGVFRHAWDAQKHCQCRQLAVFLKLSHCVWLMNFRDCNWGPLQTVLAGGLEANSIFRDAYEIVCVCVSSAVGWLGERERERLHPHCLLCPVQHARVNSDTNYIWLREKEGRTDRQSKKWCRFHPLVLLKSVSVTTT